MPPLNNFSKTCLAIGVVNAMAAPSVNAATITVSNTNDGDVFGPCTLRDAIATHNTSTNTGNCVAVGSFDMNRIEFNLPNPSTINLVDGPLEITGQYLDILGPGEDALTINASGVDNAFSVNNAHGVLLDGLTIDRGATLVINSNVVRLENSTIRNNTTSGYGGGVFIDQSSDVTIFNSLISNNTAYAGGGISILDSSRTVIESSTITGNSTTGNNGSGGGIRFGLSSGSNPQTLNVIDSTISNNAATGTGIAEGGGIATISYFSPNSPARLIILRSNISNNRASSGGGIDIGSGSEGNVITDSTISANIATSNGGGVSMGFAAPVSFNRTTLSNNSASSGGGIFGDSITMSNSTVSSNSANSGSAIRHIYSTYAIPSVIDQSTIVGNVGSPALFFDGRASNRSTFTFEANNVISNNLQGNCSADNTLPISFGTFNWLDDDSCGTLNSGDPLGRVSRQWRANRNACTFAWLRANWGRFVKYL